jgi:hypothetical protein
MYGVEMASGDEAIHSDVFAVLAYPDDWMDPESAPLGSIARIAAQVQQGAVPASAGMPAMPVMGRPACTVRESIGGA